MKSRLSAGAFILFALTLASASATFCQVDEAPAVDIATLSGTQIYGLFCSRCHGDDGKGDIPEEMLENMEAPPPDLTEPYFSSRERRKDWATVIKHGGSARGLSMSMPAWGESLTDLQIEESVEFMKTFVDQDAYPQGELNFIRGHYPTKAFVEQEALLLPTSTVSTQNGSRVRTTDLVFYYANRLGNRFQYEVKLPLRSRSMPGSTVSGIGDMEAGWKYAFHDNFRNVTIASAGLEASLPTGHRSDGLGSGTVVVTPYLAGGFGWKDVVQVQASTRVAAPLDQSKRTPEWTTAVSVTLTLPDAKHGFFPGVEGVVVKDVTTRSYFASVVPKLYVGLTKKGHLAISVASEIPVAGRRPFDARWKAFFLWDYVDGGLWW